MNNANARTCANARDLARLFATRAKNQLIHLGGYTDDIIVEPVHDDAEANGTYLAATVTYTGDLSKLPIRLTGAGFVTESGLIPFGLPSEPRVTTRDNPGGHCVDFFAEVQPSTPASLMAPDRKRGGTPDLAAHRVYGGKYVLDLEDLSLQLRQYLQLRVRPTDLRLFDRDGSGHSFAVIDASQLDVDDEAGTLVALLSTTRKIDAPTRGA